MTAGEGIFVRALGADFARLHPQLQRRFGVGVAAGYGCIGRGVMTELRRGAWWTVPFLRFGTLRNIMFPERASDVPFRIDNHPYIDGFGRETVTFVRTMQMTPRRRRRFDATMIHSARRGGIVDYLGSVIDLEVRNRWFGRLFGYRGEFTCTYPPASDIPETVKPYREEHRE